MKMKTLSLLVLFVFVFVFVSVSVSLAQNNISVFILAGQSNMGGSGGLVNGTWDGVLPPQCEPNPRILRLSMEMKWEEAREPLHKLGTNVKGYGIGPGMPFANSLLKRDPAVGVIGLVPCAVYGSYIKSWSRDGLNYTRMMARARAAVREGGVLRGFLWYQGESDAVKREDAEAYRGRLEELFGSVRADLDSPHLPIIEVALASGADFKQEIRQAQLQTQTQLPNVKCVDAAGLPLDSDAASQCQMSNVLTQLPNVKL